ncbi:YHS domain-containing (seleno)protein [Pedobacter cryotolerans]|uniref:YHS domain-containing protein n=1 Tax=Pedobacter cryotolerans TaxID=2571270 RepID=A0A4U1C7A7_9SPHI|nr:YHS domain-containing (seleno)protein [Pedobacter cryotolerans]TKC01996.1 YHS domain-containing protein [Pedobacter cryotolerans]
MKTIIAITMLLFSVNSAFAQTAKRVKHFNVEKSTLAIDGYDPVSYFTSNKAVKGKSNIVAVYDGITYRFASEQNRAAFKANPAKYEPQFGGWCAYAMGDNGEKVSINPETFKIVNGKLYLFYNKFFNNTLKDWNENENELKQKAEKNWTKFN